MDALVSSGDVWSSIDLSYKCNNPQIDISFHGSATMLLFRLQCDNVCVGIERAWL
jgi:hypothetical protein